MRTLFLVLLSLPLTAVPAMDDDEPSSRIILIPRHQAQPPRPLPKLRRPKVDDVIPRFRIESGSLEHVWTGLRTLGYRVCVEVDMERVVYVDAKGHFAFVGEHLVNLIGDGLTAEAIIKKALTDYPPHRIDVVVAEGITSFTVTPLRGSRLKIWMKARTDTGSPRDLIRNAAASDRSLEFLAAVDVRGWDPSQLTVSVGNTTALGYLNAIAHSKPGLNWEMGGKGGVIWHDIGGNTADEIDISFPNPRRGVNSDDRFRFRLEVQNQNGGRPDDKTPRVLRAVLRHKNADY